MRTFAARGTDRTGDARPAVVVASVAAVLVGAAGLSLAAGPWRVTAGAVAASGCLGLGRLVLRTPAARREPRVWLAFSRAFVALAVALLVELLVGVLVAAGRLGPSWDGLAFAFATIVFCTFTYHGVTLWNPVRADNAGDWINGVGAVLVTMAIVGVVLGVTGAPMARWPVLEQQLFVGSAATLVILGSSAATIARLAGPGSGPRLGVVAAACTAALVLQVWLGLVAGASIAVASTQVVWTGLLGVIGLCSLLPPPTDVRSDAVTTSATVGALVVAACGCLVLVAAGLTWTDQKVLFVVAAVGTMSSGFRLLHLIESLAQLARSRKEAHTDDLTGIANRRALTVELARVEQRRRRAALLIIDLDRFKEVNDRYGHAVGDEVLLAVAERIRRTAPPEALLSRQGGDEFAVLLRGGMARDAVGVAEALVHACQEPVDTSVGERRMMISVGVATTAFGSRGDGELMRRADTAMYVAKQAGGGVAVFDEESDRRARHERARVEELQALLDPDAGDAVEDQIVVFLQPQLEVATGRVVGAEALVRWQHPEDGLLPPARFLDLVERHHLMDRLTPVVLRQAVRHAADWRRLGHHLRVSVNLSASGLGDPRLIAEVNDTVAAAGLELGDLVLEITETTLMSDSPQASATIHELAAMGVGVSIDDYGTGYASLAYLTDLPAVELKLDRTFVSRVVHDRRTSAVVASTIDLAHGLGLRMVAEGVEDEETLRALRGLGCDESQGYFHARPMDPAAFLTWLDAHARRDAGPGPEVAPLRPAS